MSTGITGKRNNEILTDVHDHLSSSIRTTLTNADVNINVSAFTDSIKIGDGTGTTATITSIGTKKNLDVVVNDISISQTDDSIRIGDGTNLVTASTVSGKTGLDVNIVNQQTTTVIPSGQTELIYGEVLNLAINGSTNVVNYTIPAGNPHYLQKVYFSGTQVGTATIQKNATTIMLIRLSPTVFTQVLDLATGSAFGFKLLAGDTVTIIAENNGTSAADFNATVQLMET